MNMYAERWDEDNLLRKKSSCISMLAFPHLGTEGELDVTSSDKVRRDG